MYIIGSVLIIPAIIFAMVAQGKVSGAFNRYSQIPTTKGLTAAQVARKLLDENGCGNVQVQKINGQLTDHYDPKKKTVSLSTEVYDSTSLAAVGIAAHECGHAIQDHTNYPPLKLRQLVIKTTSIVNKLLIPLIIIGLIASIFVTGTTIMGIAAGDFWFILVIAFCAMYAISFIINLITLPTEYNASARAKKLLSQGNYLFDEDEQQAVSRVLSAAALTYVAGLVISLVYLLRFLGIVLMMTGNRRR